MLKELRSTGSGFGSMTVTPERRDYDFSMLPQKEGAVIAAQC